MLNRQTVQKLLKMKPVVVAVFVMTHLVAITCFSRFATWACRPPMWESNWHIFLQEAHLSALMCDLRIVAWVSLSLWFVAPVLARHLAKL